MVKATLALALTLFVLGFVAGCGGTKTKSVVVTPASGGPIIALGHRIGPVSFAEAKAKVTKALGGLGVEATLDGHHFRFYRRPGIYVDYADARAQQFAVILLTRSPRYKTRSGVGVGSSLHQLRSRVRVTCDGGSPSQCTHQGTSVNRPLTVFNIDPATKRVVEVAIAPGGD